MGGQDASGTLEPRATRRAAALATPSTRPIRCRSTSGGFWAGWLCCWLQPRPSCCASRRVRPTQSLQRYGGGGSGLSAVASPAAKNNQLLNVLKEEMFSLESDKIHGAISEEEFARVKGALEIVLKRALSKKQ